ncbi:histidine kinase N-terminal 7TM domain-containing protein [Leptospira santarosai]|uniref:LIC10906 family membrane protein n=1 Tax=Leptospira santarosai TaxID=28183 RepID=UPI0024AF6B7B|nr:histidine kinase N-terminal 7TM domain-containing protein [Leptospira santarosai]MDI7202048.1 histidine kinase N-terminal 7TM domain-containing protein [Leptospira santarosai]
MEFAVCISFVVLFVGVYVYRIPRRRVVRRWFLLLCCALAAWIGFLGLRFLLPLELRIQTLNIALLPVIFAPYFFFKLIDSTFRPHRVEPSINKLLNAICIGYFLVIVFFGRFAEVQDVARFAYKPTGNYHLLIVYCSLYFLASVVVMWRGIRGGTSRVRAILISSGTVVALLTTILFVYFLPLRGIFLAHYSSIGVGIGLIIIGIAMVQDNIFRIKWNLLSGADVPLLSKISLGFVLALYKFSDPREYESDYRRQRVAFAENLLYSDLELRLKTDLDAKTRALFLVDKYKKYIK